jgi:peptide/nickel transport system permease protein
MIALLSFAVRRIATAASLLLALSICTFVIFFKIPSDPGYFLLPDPQKATLAQHIAARRALGVDRPVYTQYISYLGRLIHGDLGVSWGSSFLGPDGLVHGTPVRDLLTQEAGVTGSLVLGGAVLLILLAVPLGAIAAARADSKLDCTLSATSLLGISLHPLVLGVALQLVLAQKLHVFPGGGYCPLRRPAVGPAACGGPLDWASHLALPWLMFALFFIALYMRIIRIRMVEALGEQYIQTARAKGAPEWRIIAVHALPNAIPPVVTMIAMDVGMAAGIAVYVETVFNLPGIGHALLNALSGNVGFDLPMIAGIVILLAVVIITVNLLADFMTAILDPRIRETQLRPARQPPRL